MRCGWTQADGFVSSMARDWELAQAALSGINVLRAKAFMPSDEQRILAAVKASRIAGVRFGHESRQRADK